MNNQAQRGPPSNAEERNPAVHARDGPEQVVELSLTELYPFKNHPFHVVDDVHMESTAQSIKNNGVLVPVIVRPRAEGGYEIISGHRRKRACEMIGKETIPAIVRDLDDDAATLFMVDSNLQREQLLPSERAFAFKMKLDALKHQGKRTAPTSAQVGQKLKTSIEKVAEKIGESKTQVQRYIRLTHLIPQLLQLVDERQIAFSPAVELSFLNHQEQIALLDAMDSEQARPSLSQAQRLRKLSESGSLNINRGLAKRKKTLADAEKRIAELDTIFKRLYEDTISGKLSDERFQKLSTDYEKEQHQLQDVAISLRDEIEAEERKSANVERFLSVVERYTEIPELTPCILHEFVEKIVVHAASDPKGKNRTQEIDIYYKGIGALEVSKVTSSRQE